MVGGGEIERKLVLKEGWKPWRPDRGEVRVEGKRLVWAVWWRWRSEVTALSLKQALAAALPGSDAWTGCSSSSSTALQETAINRPPSPKASRFRSWILRHSHTSHYSTSFIPMKLLTMKNRKE